MIIYQARNVAAMAIAAGLLLWVAGISFQQVAVARVDGPASSPLQTSGIAIAALPSTTGADSDPRPQAEKGRPSPEKVWTEPDLAKRVHGSIVKAIPVSKDCMILAYLPNQNLGHIDNFGLANNDGGVRA